MADPARARKVADRIKVVVAEHLEHRIKDERLGFVTITDVRVTGDLQHATVFYTAYGSDEERTATAGRWSPPRARSAPRSGRQLGIRLTPTLDFIPDALPEGAAHLEDVLAVTRERDAELARVREGKTFAGDADPYRKPTEDDDAEQSPRDRARLRADADGCCRRQAGGLDQPRRGGPGRAGCAAPAGSVTPAPSTRWPPACSSSASAGRPSCSPSSSGATRRTPRRSASGRRRSPTTPRVRSLAEVDAVGRDPGGPARRGGGRLTGPIEQVPSSVSAIKVDGKRSYARVRAGEDVALAARPVTVHRFDVLDVRPQGPYVDVDIEVEVSSGTYVRALARDLGAALGVGGHLDRAAAHPGRPLRPRVGDTAGRRSTPSSRRRSSRWRRPPAPSSRPTTSRRRRPTTSATAGAYRRRWWARRSSPRSPPTAASWPCSTSPGPRRARPSSSPPADATTGAQRSDFRALRS